MDEVSKLEEAINFALIAGFFIGGILLLHGVNQLIVKFKNRKKNANQ